jgi:hypothetical protein
MSSSLFVIERARPEAAAELLDYLKVIGGETDNLSFGAASTLLEEGGSYSDQLYECRL